MFLPIMLHSVRRSSTEDRHSPFAAWTAGIFFIWLGHNFPKAKGGETKNGCK